MRDDALRPPQYMYANRITGEKGGIDARHAYKFHITKNNCKIIMKRGSVRKTRFISTSFYNTKNSDAQDQKQLPPPPPPHLKVLLAADRDRPTERHIK